MAEIDRDKSGRRRQADRSQATRRKLFEATIELLVERGYAGTSTQEVAERAGVSRGAMLHHFSTRAELMSGTLSFLYQNEIEDFLTHIDLSNDLDLVEVVWGLYRRPEAKAVFELWLAARNDAELGAVMAPDMERVHEIYRGLWEPIARFLYPAGSDLEISAYKTRFDMALATLMGMAVAKALVPSAKLMDDEETVLSLLRETLRPSL